MDINNIIDKTAYFGNHTFEATKEGNSIRIDVYSNCPKKYQASYFFTDKLEIVELADSPNSGFKSFTGSLSGTYYEKGKKKGKKKGKIKMVEW